MRGDKPFSLHAQTGLPVESWRQLGMRLHSSVMCIDFCRIAHYALNSFVGDNAVVKMMRILCTMISSGGQLDRNFVFGRFEIHYTL